VLPHAALTTPDPGAAALGALAAYLSWRWLESPDSTRAVVAGLALGLAKMTKGSRTILFGLWPPI
jgi:4-amino-4-deoxy-L-arabinose transferase-like glycosyltransferase